jgi:hypothetical protein
LINHKYGTINVEVEVEFEYNEEVDENYGADADGNRGCTRISITDVKISNVARILSECLDAAKEEAKRIDL